MSDRPQILLADPEGDFLGLAILLKEEQYPFLYINLQKDAQGIGEGLLDEGSEKTLHIWRHILRNKPEDIIIVLPDQNQGHQWDFLRKKGYTIIGGGNFAENMEYKRSKGLLLMKEMGLSIPKEEDFTSLRDAISYMEEQKDDARKYFKGEGEDMAGNSFTYGGKNKQDMILYLTWLKDSIANKGITIKKFILQDTIEGYTVDFSFYFDGQNILPGSIALDLEEKKGGDGKFGGSALGCSTNVIYFLKETKYKKFFDRLVPYLRRVGYVGQWSINNVFRKEDGEPFGLEHTPRFGWDSHATEQIMHRLNGKKASDFILALARRGKFEFPHSLVGYGVRLHCDYPTTPDDKVKGRYFTFDESIKDNIYFYNVSKKDEHYVIEKNPAGVAVTAEKTFEASVKKMNDDILPKINMADMFVRSNPPQDIAETMRFLKKFEWI